MFQNLTLLKRCALYDVQPVWNLLVGFPGETEDDFADTLRLIDEVGYAGAFSFKYSPRPGTPGANMRAFASPSSRIAW